MNETNQANPPNLPEADEGGIDKKGLLVTAGFAALLGISWLAAWELVFLIAAGALIAIVIWQACDPFAEAAQWVGTTLHIPGSVRGATLDAVASSMPEFFSGIFFVIVALQMTTGGDQAATDEAIRAAGGEGYGSTIATCAGSAVYNMILIPAAVAIAVSFYRKSRPTVDIESEVLTRDGTWFLMCELIMLGFLYQDRMYWWMGVVFIVLYIVYIMQLYNDARRHRRQIKAIDACLASRGMETPAADVVYELRDQNIKTTLNFVEKRLAHHDEDDDDDDAPDQTPVLFGLFHVPINKTTAPMILIFCTIFAAAACYGLVKITHGTADILGVQPFFVAVILAAAVSSVPDTFLSVGAAMRGDDSGAVSNAFGSNIFDICICLSIPLLVSSYLIGWQPVELIQIVDGKAEPLAGLVGLRILLWVLTVITLIILWHNKQLTRFKAFILIALYLVFVGYAVLGSLNVIDV